MTDPKSSTKIRIAAPPANSAIYVHPGDVLWMKIAGGTVGHEQTYERPWVVISENRAHKRGMDMVVGVPLSKQIQHLPLFREARVLVTPEEIESTDDRFNKTACLALTENMRSFSVDRCDGVVGKVSKKVVNDIRAGVSFMLDL